MIRAVIFDLGGTLLDFNPRRLPWLVWEQIGLESAHAYLTSQGHALAKEAFVSHVQDMLPERWERAAQGGPNLRLGEVLSEACASGGVSPTTEEIDQAIVHYISPLDAEVVAYGDTVETLDALREQGHKIGLISNTMWPGQFHRQEMVRFNLLPYFDLALFSADAGIWKPQPGIYQRVIDALGVTAAEAVYVGDSPEHDIVGAHAAGMRGIYKRNAKFPLDDIHPDAEIAHLSELPDLVKRW
jgi:HAD superfamily hydrolase (TIGR01549 family)